MNPRTESSIDFFLDRPMRIWVTLLCLLLICTGIFSCSSHEKPTYKDMAEQTIIVQTGTTECHYVPAWEAISCVTLPRAYGPEAPVRMP